MYIVVGLGITGWSCIEYLVEQGQRLCVMDTRVEPPLLSKLREQYPSIAFHGGPLSLEFLEGVDTIVMSPGIAPRGLFFETAKAKGIPFVGDIELFMRAVQAPVIGITGTNGKSTVTTLVAELLLAAGYSVKVGGNLGTPALALLSAEVPDVYVLELSSYQLEGIDHLPLLSATILNVAPDHLDRHGTLENYKQAKQRIYREAQSIVVNRADPYTLASPASPTSSTWRFGLSAPEDDHDFGIALQKGEPWFMQGKKILCPVSTLSLVGLHNQENALAALALVASFDIPTEVIRSVFQSFKGLSHRCQVILEREGVRWINDSKATNVAASVSAIAALKRPSGKMIILLGGKPKQEDYSVLIPTVLDCARGVVLMGEAAALLEPLWEPYRDEIAVRTAHSMQEAVKLASTLAEPGDMVLLSPACPSYDWYQNYEERGHDFVKKLQAMVQSTD